MTNTKASKVFVNRRKKVNDEVNTYKAKRTLKIGGEKRWPGELVPEAHFWLRVNNFTHSGYIEEVRVPVADFDKAVEDYCPDQADRLAELAKGAPVADKEDTKFTGFVYNEDAEVVDVAAQRKLERERKLANTAPNDRPASFDAGGTPADLDDRTEDHVHSDGGSTLYTDKQSDFVEKLLDPNTEEVDTPKTSGEGITDDKSKVSESANEDQPVKPAKDDKLAHGTSTRAAKK